MANNIIGTVGVGAQSVKPDWNQNDPNAKDYIKNRPGGYVIPPSVEITWDGDATGKETVDVGDGLTLVKVADEAPSIEKFASDVNPNAKAAQGPSYVALVRYDINGETAQEEVDLWDEDGHWIGFWGELVIVGVTANSADVDVFDNGDTTTLSKGLWFSTYETEGK